MPGPLDPIQRIEALSLFRRDHLSLRAIGRQLGSNAHTVKRTLLSMGVPEEEFPRGRKSKKKTRTQVQKLIAAPAEDWTLLKDRAPRKGFKGVTQYVRYLIRKELESFTALSQ